MSAFHSFFVRVPPAALPDQAVRAVAYQLRSSGQLGTYELRFYAGSSWLEVQCPSYASVWGPAQAISRRLATDVLALAVQTNAEAMELRFARNGRDEREILYSRSAGGWIASRGAPLPWEAEAFFPDADRDVDLEVAVNDQERGRIRAAYATHTLQAGSDLPLLDTRGALAALSRALELPGLHPEPPLPEAVRRVRVAPTVDVVAMLLMAAGVALVAMIWSALVGSWGLLGFPLSWGGFAIRYRRASRTMSIGGGFVAAAVLSLAAVFIASRVR